MDNFLALFYLLTGAVWLYRSYRAIRALQEIPQVLPAPPLTNAPLVSILVPVKNEEVNLEECLRCLLGQDYPSKEIIVINDHSTDRTGQILSEYARLYPKEVRAVNAPDLPSGWTGKNWALSYGTPLAQGKWLLFTDADTRHESCSVSSAVSHSESKDLDLLTLSPRCLVHGFWEKVLQPIAMGFLGLWFPFAKVNRPDSRITFGNGQYLLIRKTAYERIGGHSRVREAFLEDFALVKEAKKARFRAEVAIGTKVYATRMYRSFSGIWLGWRRIFFHAFEKNPFFLSLRALEVFAFSFLPFFLFPFFTQPAFARPEHFGKLWGASFPILALILLTAWKSHGILSAPRAYALLHPFAGFVLASILTDAAWAAIRKKELKWR